MAHTKLFFENALRRPLHIRLTPLAGTLQIAYGPRAVQGGFRVERGTTVYHEIDDRIRSCMHRTRPPDTKKARLSYELVPYGKPQCTVAVERGRENEGPVFIFEELPN